MLCVRADAQCRAAGAPSRIHQLYVAKEWDAVARAAEGSIEGSADDAFEYGMALAHLQRWNDARAALTEGHRRCPADKRFPEELAGVAFQQKQYPETAAWLRDALKLDPHDEYGLNFAGTTYYLMGNLDAALKYWNRVRKPYIASLQIDQNLKLERRVLDRAFAFSPAAVLQRDQFAATEARLRGLGIYPVYSLGLHARPDGKFDAEFHAFERDGFGSNRWQALISIFGGLPYETVYPAYYNAGHGGLNLESLFRWDAEKQRTWAQASAPVHGLPQWRWAVATDNRWENWSVRPSFTENAPEAGSLRLIKQAATASFSSLRSGRTQWTLGGEVSHRRFTNVANGSALSSSLIDRGFQIKQVASIENKTIDIPEHRFTIDTGAYSEAARLWSTPARLYEKLQGDAHMRWFPQPTGDVWEVQQRVRAGTAFGTPPFDELWMLGVERDNELWLRGVVGARGGKKGSAPIADRYFLSNTDLIRRVYSNGLISIKAGPLFDAARAAAPTGGLTPHEWLYSAGGQVKLTVFGVGAVITYGRDLRTGNNAFFATLAQ